MPRTEYREIQTIKEDNYTSVTAEIYGTETKLTIKPGTTQFRAGTSQLRWEQNPNNKEWELSTITLDTGWKTFTQTTTKPHVAVIGFPIPNNPPFGSATIPLHTYITNNHLYLDSPHFKFKWPVIPAPKQ